MTFGNFSVTNVLKKKSNFTYFYIFLAIYFLIFHLYNLSIIALLENCYSKIK
jgi:hypothetical protein